MEIPEDPILLSTTTPPTAQDLTSPEVPTTASTSTKESEQSASEHADKNTGTKVDDTLARKERVVMDAAAVGVSEPRKKARGGSTATILARDKYDPKVKSERYATKILPLMTTNSS